jgi:hypothetical protein
MAASSSPRWIGSIPETCSTCCKCRNAPAFSAHSLLGFAFSGPELHDYVWHDKSPTQATSPKTFRTISTAVLALGHPA